MKWKVEGLKEVSDALRVLPDKLSISLLRSVNRRVLSKEVVKPLRAAVSHQSFKKGIKVFTDKANKTGAVVGPDSKVFWIRFVQKGTKERFKRGKITAHNTIEPTIDQSIDNVIKFAGNEYEDEMIKFMSKKLKRLRKI